MADEMDRVQALNDLHLETALKAHSTRPQRAGLWNCEDPDCGEPISAQRQAMGARLCLECQQADEARAAHFRQWGGR